MYHLPSDTVAGIKAGPLFLKRSRALVALPRVAVQSKNYCTGAGQTHVEREALQFYLLNHLFWAISRKRAELEVLPEGELLLLQRYDATASAIAKRLFFYTLLICTRESRHMHKSQPFYDSLKKKFGPEFLDFHFEIRHGGSTGVVNEFHAKPPMMLLGDFVSGLAHIFYKGPFSHGYGGKPWGDIAETLRKLVYGETSFEMFADTAFTLCHNGGPMFNKGMLYHMYDGAALYKILDVQRSGQVPELVGTEGAAHVTSEMNAVLNQFRAMYPTEVGAYVDWFKVEAAGAIHKYPTEKQKQLAAHGTSKVAVQEKKKIASRFYLMPNVWVTKYNRKVAA